MKLITALTDQPRGVYLMFCTEFWERFSYYGFMAILVFFMTASPANGGLGWSRANALLIFGAVTGAIWIAPVMGGWIADRWIGARRAVIGGCVGLAAGNLVLSISAGIAARPDIGRAVQAYSHIAFWIGLMSLMIGAGLFKSNASALLGEVFAPDDPRRDGGFTLFYMGINLGALAAPLGAGTLGERIGWSYGFLAAGVGMLIGLGIFLWGAPRVLPPERKPTPQPVSSSHSTNLLHDPGVQLILVMALFATVFTTGLMQYGGLLNLYVATSVDREIFGWTVPATWFLTLNPLLVILLGPWISEYWEGIARRSRRDLFAPKILTGLLCMATAFGTLTAVELARHADPATPWALVVYYTVLTAGELCVLPAGLAEISRRAPASAVGMLMGVWILTLGVGSLLAGWLGSAAETLGTARVFGMLAILAVLAAAVLSVIASHLPGQSTSTCAPR